MNATSFFDQPFFLEPGDGYAYFIGQFWHRIKLDTLSAERTSMPRSCRKSTTIYATSVSAPHFGMVAWNHGQLLRITIDEASIPRSKRPIAK